MVYKRMTRSGMCKLSQQWEMLYLQCSNGDKSDVFFCPFTVQHILYLCNFPAQITLLLLHVGNRMCYNINVVFFVPFRDIEKGKVFCRAILIIIHLEIVRPSRKAAEGKS